MKMIRGPPLRKEEDFEEYGLAELELRSRETEEWKRLRTERDEEQKRRNERLEECKATKDSQQLLEVSKDQIILDNRMINRHEDLYDKDQNLRLEAVEEIKARKASVQRIAVEVLQGTRRALPIEQPNRREELHWINAPKRERTRWPDPTPTKIWTAPPKRSELREKDQMTKFM